MRYQGGKFHLAKFLVPFIHGAIRSPSQLYWEPFVGGGNMIQQVDHGLRMGSDIHAPTVGALRLIRDQPDRLPHQVSRELYQALRGGDAHPFRDYILHACSYRGIYNGGLADAKNVASAWASAQKQSPRLAGVRFVNGSYDSVAEIKIIAEATDPVVIYCDPPYINTLGYSGNKGAAFDHGRFWSWVRRMTLAGHIVLVSESVAPRDFDVIYETSIPNSLGKPDASGMKPRRDERLFCHRRVSI